MRLVLLLCSIFLFGACKNSTTPETVDPFVEAEKAYLANPDNATANSYLDQILASLSSPTIDDNKLVELSEKGLEISRKMNLPPRTRTFLFSLLKEDYGNAATPERLLELADHMIKVKRPKTANILYKAIIEKFGGSKSATSAQEKIDPNVTKLDNYLINIGEEIFKGDVNKIGINRNAALKYVDACEAYALGFPYDNQAPSYLFRAAEIAKSIQTYPKLMSIYDWIIKKYPNYDKTPTTLFLKGFVLENDLQNDEKAIEVYEHFLNTYPEHDLVDDVKFLMENIGKSDEEIRKMIEDKQAELKEKKAAQNQ